MDKYDRNNKFYKFDRNNRYEKHEKYDKPYKYNWKYKNQKNYYYVADEGVTDEELEGDEVAFIPIKEDRSIPVDSTSCIIKEKALAAKVEEKDEWVIDSSCLHHMTGDKSKFMSMERYDGGIVRFGDDKAHVIYGKGSISFDGKHNTDGVLYVQGLKHNILSVGQIVDKGYDLQFKNGKCKILNTSGIEISSRTKTEGHIFHLNAGEKSCLISHIDEIWLWHRRMCHVNFDSMIKINSIQVVRDLHKIVKPINLVCKECQLGTQTRISFQRKQYTSDGLLDLVHADLCGPTNDKSVQGDKYFMLLIDDYSRMMWVIFLKGKYEALDKFKIFKAMVETESGLKVKYLRSDRGGEFCFGEFYSFYEKHGIRRQLSAPSYPQQNEVVERKNRGVLDVEGLC